MTVGPTSGQTKRREQAQVAKALIANESTKHIFGLAEQRALKSIRAASTPNEAWEARALLIGLDELVGLLFLVGQDEKNVTREISALEAQEAGAAAMAKGEEDHLEYMKRAEAAREEFAKNG